MTIQQLRAQIAALQDSTMDENRNFRSAYDEGKFDALSAVDALLDSLQEEPQVKKLAGLQHVNETCKENGNSLTQESVSEFPNTESMIESYKQRLISQANGVKNSPLIDMCLASYKHGINETLDTLNLSNVQRTLKNWKKPKFKVGDRIKIKGIRNEDVTRVITNIQKGDMGGFWYFFADGSIHSIGDDGIELVEEPVSNDLEEAAKSYSNNLDNICGSIGKQTRNAFKAGAKWQREKDESITKDLGEYINELSKQFPEVSFAKLSRIAVRVAKWQKEKDQESIETAIHHAYHNGRLEMKEQMIAKAIDAQVLENYDGKVIRYDETILDEKLSDCKVFDKVKVIVIKED